jgi:hypothetical protein
LAVTSDFSIANIDTAPIPTGEVDSTLNPTAYTNKPSTKDNKSVILKSQRLLKSKGMLRSSADGIAGFDTKQAVEEYQIEKNLATSLLVIELV